jgi:hypothetical protein
LAVVFEGELNFGFGVEGWGVGPGAGCGEVAGGGQAQAVKKGKQKNEKVPGEHGVGKMGVPEAGDEAEEAGQ